MLTVDDELYALSRALEGAGYGREALDLSIDVLGTAPQSRDPALRRELLVRMRVLFWDVYGVEALIRMSR